MARGLTAAGWLQRSTGDMAGALASFEQARRVAEEVETEGGAAEQARGVLGTAYSLTGNVLADTGDPAGRGPPTTRRWPSGRELADANPGDKEFRRNLAAAHNSIGLLQSRTGDPSGALAGLPRGAGHPAKAGRRQPRCHGIPARPVVESHEHRDRPVRDRRPRRARAAYGKALAIRQRLADANPTVTMYPGRVGERQQQPRLTALEDGRSRPGRGQLTARRSRSARSCPTPTPVSFSSVKNWRKASTTSATCCPRRATWPGRGRPTARRWPSRRSWPTPTLMSLRFQREVAMSHNNIGALRSQTGDPRRCAGFLRPGAGHPAEAGGRQPQHRRVPAGRGDEPQQHRRDAGEDG